MCRVSHVLIAVTVWSPHCHFGIAVGVLYENLEPVCQNFEDCVVCRLVQQDSVCQSAHSTFLESHDGSRHPVDSPLCRHLANAEGNAKSQAKVYVMERQACAQSCRLNGNLSRRA